MHVHFYSAFTLKPGSRWRHERRERHRKKSSQIASLTLTFSTIWLVGRWLTLATLRWNRNRVYSSVTSTLATLRWRERHIVNQAWHIKPWQHSMVYCGLNVLIVGWSSNIIARLYQSTAAWDSNCLDWRCITIKTQTLGFWEQKKNGNALFSTFWMFPHNSSEKFLVELHPSIC